MLIQMTEGQNGVCTYFSSMKIKPKSKSGCWFTLDKTIAT